MSPGQFVRRLLGPMFPPIGAAWRRLFVDMPAVVRALQSQIPPNAHVLDVGGGEGYVVSLLLRQRPDLRVTMTDLSPVIGGSLTPDLASRVSLHPATDVGAINGAFDIAIVTDVLHHVPASVRPALLAKIVARAPAVLIKDVRPNTLQGVMSYLADHYITGDRGVRLVDESEAIRLADAAGLHNDWKASPSWGNYCLGFKAGPAPTLQ